MRLEFSGPFESLNGKHQSFPGERLRKLQTHRAASPYCGATWQLSAVVDPAADCMLRKTKAECLQLPPKSREFQDVEVAPEAAAEYQRRLEQARVLMNNSNADDRSALILLRHFASDAKAKAAAALAAEVLRRGRPVVLATCFRSSAVAIQQALQVCRGTWARVTIGRFRHLALQNISAKRASSNIFSNQMGGTGDAP
jgi:hypothetical protein